MPEVGSPRARQTGGSFVGFDLIWMLRLVGNPTTTIKLRLLQRQHSHPIGRIVRRNTIPTISFSNSSVSKYSGRSIAMV
jgi:hypothetical protein